MEVTVWALITANSICVHRKMPYRYRGEDDVLEALGGGQRFSCLDLASGYWTDPKQHSRPIVDHSNGGLCHLDSPMGQLVLPD